MRCLTLFLCAAVLTHADEKPIPLFNGKDLTGFYTYLGAEGNVKGAPALGKNNDPKKVFTVVEADGKPAIRVSGEIWGCFTTEKEFENYKLLVEFKWGKETHAPRKSNTRDSGILLHCIGEDGAHGPWMESIECQLIEGGTGDFIVCSGKGKKPKITCESEMKPTGPKGAPGIYFKPGGEKKEVTSGRVNWYGRDPMWKDEIGFRGKDDVEKPLGKWNNLEITCVKDVIEIRLNETLVNRATNIFPTKGKILFQSEGAEVLFRKIDLVPMIP